MQAGTIQDIPLARLSNTIQVNRSSFASQTPSKSSNEDERTGDESASLPVRLSTTVTSSRTSGAGEQNDDARSTETEMRSLEGSHVQPPRGTEAFDSYPDGGGFAWMQVFCCFNIFFASTGGIYAWGVLQKALYEDNVAPASKLLWVGSTQATFQALFAIPFIRLVAAYGPRNVAIIGSLFAGFGPILAGFCTRSLPGLIVTEGIFFGIGQALCFHCIATLPSNYFLHKRNLATGLVYAGGGLGGGIFSLIADRLFKATSIAWTFRILGFIFLVMSLPSSWYLRGRNPRIPLRRPKTDQQGAAGGQTIEWALFKDPKFIMMFLAMAVAVFPLFIPPFFLPLFGSSIGLTPVTSSLLLAGFNFSSAAGRITFGAGADALLGSINSFLLCLVGQGITTMAIWPFSGSIGPLSLFIVVNGFCAGGFFSLLPGVVASLFATKRLSVVFGMLVTAFSPGYFLGAPVAGYLLQAFGGPSSGYIAYRPAIFFSGGLTIFSAILIGAIRYREGGDWRRKI